MTDLTFSMTLKNHVIGELCDFMEGSSSFYIPTLSSLVAIDIMVVDIE